MMRAFKQPGVQRWCGLGRPFSALGLQDIPGPKAWPIVGALPDFMSRVNGMTQPKGPQMNKAYDEYYHEFGDIYRLRLVGEENVMVCRPDLYMQMYRNEGMYPVGALDGVWIAKRWMKENGKKAMYEWSSTGEPWRKYRLAVQEDIIGPKTARSYLPYINESVNLASTHLPNFAKEPNEFTTCLAFDMFSALFYGRQMKTTSPDASPEDMDFVRNTRDMFKLMGTSLFNRHLQMGIFRHHPVNRDFNTAFQRSFDYSCRLLDEALERSKNMPADTKPYIVRITDRGSIPLDEIKDIAASLLLAGIDTTQSVISWNLVNLAKNPDKQEILRQELREVLGSGDLTEEIAANMKTKLPYLRAVIRESHRITPASAQMVVRPAPCDLELGGYNVPEGTRVSFNVFSVQNDPKYVEDPSEFKPERWLADAVEARKGTEAEVIDDKLLATPFSFGARMCLGGRVADLELSVAIARLVREWRISLPKDQPDWINVQPLLTTPSPFPAFVVEAAS
mmetsp:Transcript_52057/g.122187  ORF Transcript_52057/g.122187 Transcript_52057/m.122187 type:complete len:507 (+) Transcript_52057:41-1561(+)